MLGLGVVWWSMATVLTPIAAHISLPVLLGMRALMGIGEGVAMPAMNNMLSRWVPASERSRSLALVYSGMYTGSMLGLGLSPGLIASSGWPSVFYIFGGFGVVWWLIWTFRASSTPAESKTIDPEELKFITANTSVSTVLCLPSLHVVTKEMICLYFFWTVCGICRVQLIKSRGESFCLGRKCGRSSCHISATTGVFSYC